MVVELLRDGVGRELLKAVAGNVTLTGMELLIVHQWAACRQQKDLVELMLMSPVVARPCSCTEPVDDSI